MEILCAEMARAFSESGTPLPPWRQFAAMLSKWQPRRSEEVDVTAALNNGAGLLLPPMPVGGGQVQPGAVVPMGGAAAKRHLTGPSTVAQRLMMLGVVQQQSNPSPISEGVEHAGGSEEEGLNGWEALDGDGAAASTPTSSASSLHLDWEEATGAVTPAGPPPALPAALGGHAAGNGGGPPLPAGARPLAVPLRTASGSQAPPTAAAELPGRPPMGPARGKAILEGIRAAVSVGCARLLGVQSMVSRRLAHLNGQPCLQRSCNSHVCSASQPFCSRSVGSTLHSPALPHRALPCRPRLCPIAATTRGRAEAARCRRRRACSTRGPRPAAPAPLLPPCTAPAQPPLLAQPSQDI